MIKAAFPRQAFRAALAHQVFQLVPGALQRVLPGQVRFKREKHQHDREHLCSTNGTGHEKVAQGTRNHLFYQHTTQKAIPST
jgi:hypothetical protein